MRTKREFRNREETEVAVLDALVERSGEGMTIFELRTRVDVEIDALESVLSSLKDEGLINTERSGSQLVITPADCVLPDEQEVEYTKSILERIRDHLPF
ncbi:DUF6432 family protein [Halocatena marina]|uniref:DUF6432 family protein n=1 Tax=Halocatena marina TaxID=2934937 RepID=A0ABD5YTZ7_9EURY|nr:DUF6432 family protein [Halocatena marina]